MGSIVRTGIFASEMSPGLKRTVVQAWPRNPSEVSDPGSVVDLCVSHCKSTFYTPCSRKLVKRIVVDK